MSSTFDNKVYEYMKDDSKLTFNDIYPFGSYVKCPAFFPPKIGTWDMVGVYGNYEYTDTNNVHHYMTFNGMFVDDFIKIDPTDKTLITINYEYPLGKDCEILVPHDCMLNSEVTNVFSGGYISNTSHQWGFMFYFNQPEISLSKQAGVTGMSCAVRIKLGPKITDISSSVFNTEGILIEYKRKH